MNRTYNNVSLFTSILAGWAARSAWGLAVAGLIFFGAAGLWWAIATPARNAGQTASRSIDTPSAAPVTSDSLTSDSLTAGNIVPMHSPAFTYSPGWRVDATGADPIEPDNPWREPSGTLEFTYRGQTLALLLAEGNYWGYLYVTVDGEPANRLAHIPGNADSRGVPGGYTTLYAPERAIDGVPVARWINVHESAETGERAVRIEMWRSWGQTPIRAVAVDALPPPPRPLWPSVLLALLGLTFLSAAGFDPVRSGVQTMIARAGRAGIMQTGRAQTFKRVFDGARTARPGIGVKFPPFAAGAGMALIALAVVQNLWWLCWLGLLLLAAAGIYRPAYWVGALCFGLPFYYSVTLPLLPMRAFGLIDIGVMMGLVVALIHDLGRHLFLGSAARSRPRAQPARRWAHIHASLLWAIIGWALVSALAAYQLSPALYEWRAVFLLGGLFWLLLRLGVGAGVSKPKGFSVRGIILGGWLAGGTVVAMIAIAQYLGDVMLITAEGVARVRGLYGSPNNLALYLERTLMVSVGLALYLPPQTAGWLRGALWPATLLQLLALILTFSKGALLLALPAGFAVLLVAGWVLLPRQGRTYAPLWQLLGLVIFTLAILLPFLGTERFSNLLDVSQGTGFFRVNLWRSAWAMSLDNWLLGVGPDNFLYAFRSRYLLPAAWQDPNLNHPHNLFLDGWTRLGLPGLLLLLTYFGGGLIRLANGLRAALPVAAPEPTSHARAFQARAVEMAQIAGLLAAAVAGLAHGLIDVSYALPDLFLVWILLFHLRGGYGQVNQHAVDAHIVQERGARQAQ